MDKKIIYGIIAVVVIVAVFLYLNPAILKGNTDVTTEKDFKTLAQEKYNILKKNDLALETLADEKLLELSATNFDKAIKELNDNKASKNAALKDLSELYILFLEELKLRKELLLQQATIDKLSGVGVCANLETLDKALETNDTLYNAVLENNKKIEDYIAKHRTEAEDIELANYLEDEDEVFINYYELKDYILVMQENCVNLGEGYVNE